jgi:hypothetical protein
MAGAERVHRTVGEVLEALPDDFFTRRERSPQWPFDLVGHLEEHRRKHLEKVLAPPERGPQSPSAARPSQRSS